MERIEKSIYNCLMFQEMRKIPKTIILCILAEILNFLTVYIFYLTLNIPLFFDTIWTVAVVFYLGLAPALCVSLGYNIINSILWFRQEGFFDPFMLSYAICGVLIVLSTWLIVRHKNEFKSAYR